MHSAIGADVWDPAVIGNFTEKDARLFLQWELDRKMTTTKNMIRPVEDKQWEKIFQVIICPSFHEAIIAQC